MAKERKKEKERRQSELKLKIIRSWWRREGREKKNEKPEVKRWGEKEIKRKTENTMKGGERGTENIAKGGEREKKGYNERRGQKNREQGERSEK